MILMFRPPEINNEVTWTTTQQNKKRKYSLSTLKERSGTQARNHSLRSSIHCSNRQPPIVMMMMRRRMKINCHTEVSFHPQVTQRPQVAIWALAGTDNHDFPVGQLPLGTLGWKFGGKQSVDSKHVWRPPGKADVPRNEVAHKKIKRMQVHEWLSICDGIDLNSCLSFLNSQSSKI